MKLTDDVMLIKRFKFEIPTTKSGLILDTGHFGKSASRTLEVESLPLFAKVLRVGPDASEELVNHIVQLIQHTPSWYMMLPMIGYEQGSLGIARAGDILVDFGTEEEFHSYFKAFQETL